MNRFVGPTMQLWEGRTVRERRLLAAMSALMAMTAAGVLVVRPAWTGRDAALERRERAQMTAAEVRHDLGRLDFPQRAASGGGSDGLEFLMRETAEAAGFASTLTMNSDGRVGFRIAAARSGAALAWIAQLESDHGLRVCQLSVIENADATVNLEGKVAPRACNAA